MSQASAVLGLWIAALLSGGGAAAVIGIALGIWVTEARGSRVRWIAVGLLLPIALSSVASGLCFWLFVMAGRT